MKICKSQGRVYSYISPHYGCRLFSKSVAPSDTFFPQPPPPTWWVPSLARLQMSKMYCDSNASAIFHIYTSYFDYRHQYSSVKAAFTMPTSLLYYGEKSAASIATDWWMSEHEKPCNNYNLASNRFRILRHISFGCRRTWPMS